MKINFVIIILICAFVTSCALKEDNPLHHKKAPSVMNNDDWSVTQRSGVLVISWTPFDMDVCDGYYIYRSLSQNGQYISLIEDGIQNNYIDEGEQMEYEDSEVLSGVFYYYKISGYKIYDDLKLEGKISAPIYGKIN